MADLPQVGDVTGTRATDGAISPYRDAVITAVRCYRVNELLLPKCFETLE